MNPMIEYMSREMIKDKIDVIAENFFDLKIVDKELRNEIENNMQDIVIKISEAVGQTMKNDEEMLPLMVSSMMDIILAQVISTKMLEKYIDFLTDERK